VRQQVQAVVRRAGAQQAPAAYAPPSSSAAPPAPHFAAPQYPASPEPSTSQRLQELETLRATGAISEQEYTVKRAQILSDL
jgi:hypothetical protein